MRRISLDVEHRRSHFDKNKMKEDVANLNRKHSLLNIWCFFIPINLNKIATQAEESKRRFTHNRDSAAEPMKQDEFDEDESNSISEEEEE